MKKKLHRVCMAFFNVIILSFFLNGKTVAAPVIYEAEKGTLTGTTISTGTAGYTGTGYVTGLDATGDKVTVTVTAATAGVYNLTIRFRCPNGPKTEDLYINNTFSSNLTFPAITGFSSFNAGGVYLKAGSNTIAIVKNWGYTEIDNFGIELAPAHSYSNVTTSLINPNADAKTKALYSALRGKYGNCILSGQTNYWSETIALAGKTPAVRGFDMQNYSPHNPWYNWTAGEDGTVQSAIDWYNSTGGKGIVTFHWHWFSPSGGSLKTSTFYTNQTDFDVSQGVISGTQQNKDILRDIDAIAVQLKKLQTAGIPVLWRPLHEAGGAWFWWGAKGSAACKSLYDIMYNRLTTYHGINNLIWVWSTPEASWYPGNAKVDVLGYDSYPGAYNYAPQKSIFDQLFTIVGGQKIIAMTENGPIPDIDQCFQQDAPWAYFMSWVDLVAAQNTKAHIVDVYNKTCNLGDVTTTTPAPSITSFTPSCGSAGTSVTITGTNLSAATSVKFNGVAGTVTTNTATQIIVKAPTGVTTGTLSVTTAGGSDVSSGTFTVAAAPTLNIAITSGVNPGCAGDALTFTATRTNGGSAPAYQWKVNGVNAGTNSATFSSSGLVSSDVVSCVLTSNAACVTTTTATSNSITLTRYTKKTPVITIALTAGANPSCAGTSQTFTATTTDGGTAPVYQWKVNGVNTGTNSAAYTSSTLANASVITCELTSNLTCVTAAKVLSNSITLTRTANVTPTVAIAITSGKNPDCAGAPITFTATPANGGTTPSYQWKVNGVNAGINSATYTSSSLANASVITCELTSNLTCVTTAKALSNNITLTRTAIVTPTVAIAITSGKNPDCAGAPITFTATPANGGTTPAYQWKVNGVNAGTNAATFVSSTLANNDVVTCVLTSNASCTSTATAPSNSITLSRTANVTPTVAIAITSGKNPDCAGTSLTFTATQSNGGTTPVYQWKVNGVNAGTNAAAFTSSTLANNDVVTCVLTSNATCSKPNMASSNAITSIKNAIPKADAGIDQVVTTNSANLSGNTPASGITGIWTTTGSASIASPSDPLTSVSNLVSGSNTFRWTLTNGSCTVYDDIIINLTTVTGINPNTDLTATYTIYPNPFKSVVKILAASNSTEKIKITITDVKGSQVYYSEDFYTNQDITLDNDMPVGVLLVQVIIGHEVNRFKIVKMQ